MSDLFRVWSLAPPSTKIFLVFQCGMCAARIDSLGLLQWLAVMTNGEFALDPAQHARPSAKQE